MLQDLPVFTAEDIKLRVRKQPFEPFRIHTSGGDRYEVHHPDLIMVGLRDLAIGLTSARSPEYYDQVARVALMHVTAVEDLPAANRPGGDGQQ